jgi:AcrR family transcriptional regulator
MYRIHDRIDAMGCDSVGREQRRGDWAAWMGAPGPVSREPVAATAPVSALRTAVAAETPQAPESEETPEAAEALEAEGPEALQTQDAAWTAVAAETPEAAWTAVAAEAPEAPEVEGTTVHRSARREATRQRLLDAAREVFAERGVIGGSVEDICERAGFTRGAFYSNFADKDEVVEALIVREQTSLLEHLDTSVADIEPEIAEAFDLAAVLHSIVDRIMRTVPVDRQLMLIQTELEIHAIRRPELSRQLLEVNSLFRERIGSFVDDALERNGRRLVVSPGDLVDTVIAISERSFRRALLAGEGADPDALASAVLPGVLLALSRPKEPGEV